MEHGSIHDVETTREQEQERLIGSLEEGVRPTAPATVGNAHGGIHPATTPAAGGPASEEETVTDTAIQEYRKHCVSAEQKAQEDYDKAVLTLSGGALGISFAFLKDVVGSGPLAQTQLLLWAWLLWSGSIVATLASFWFSQSALRTAIAQVDAGTIRNQFPGRAFARMTAFLNAIGGLTFVAGVVLMVLFVMANIGQIHPADVKPPG